MSNNIEQYRNKLEQYRNKLDEQYQISKVKRDHNHRHARGWVSSCVDYVLLGLPAIAPIPNLLNLSVALTPVLGFWAAAIAAVALELLLFGSAEIILYLQDKQMRRGNYENALRIAIGCGVAFVVILLSLILSYEVPRHGWAVLTLPFVSVISIAFLSLKRWADIRDDIERDQREDRLTATVANLETLQLQHAELQQKFSTMETKLQQAISTRQQLEIAMENFQQQKQVQMEISNGNSVETRRKQVLQCFGKSVIGNSEISMEIDQKPPTVSKDAKWLREQGYLKKNSVTETGWHWLNSGEPAIHTNGVHA